MGITNKDILKTVAIDVPNMKEQLESITINIKKFGILDDGTDQTDKIINLFKNELLNFKGVVLIPYNTKFNIQSVFSNCPVGVIIEDKSIINMYNTTTYKQKYYNIGSSDLVDNDTIQSLISGHHPCFVLNNLGTSGSVSANKFRNSLMFAHGFNENGTLKNHLINQVYEHDNKWVWALRVLQKYNAIGVVDTTILSVDEDGNVGINGARNGYNFVLQNQSTDTSVVTNMLIENKNDNSNSIIVLKSKSGGVEQTTNLRQNANGEFTIDKENNQIVGIDGKGITFKRAKIISWKTLIGETPNVSNGLDFFMNNLTPTNVTDFIGENNQEIRIVFQNANTTLKNSSKIRLKGGMDYTPTQYSSISFVKNNSISNGWIEISRSEQ